MTAETGTTIEELMEAVDWGRPGAEADVMIRELRQQVANSDGNVELLQEQLAELELALEDVGWLRMSSFGDREFSLPGLKKMRKLARLSYLKNPLIKRAVNVQADYVWGQGMSISATAEEINDVVQRFLDDPKNTISFTGHTARLDRERELRVHGSLFIPMFTNARTGRVVLRSIYPDEIEEIITNPDDYMEPWFYKRVWTEQEFGADVASARMEPKVAYYPDWRLLYTRDPNIPKPKSIGDAPVMWDAPMYHIKTGGFGDMKYGVPDIYAALDWARAVKDDLENYATVKAALARFTWQYKVKGTKTAAVKKKLGSTLNANGSGQLESNPSPIPGSVPVMPDGHSLEPIKVAGATISPEEGYRMWLMVSAATGIPQTILSGDADSGNLATAKTLDRPTELQMENRRKQWADWLQDILSYVIDCAAIAGNGLSGHFKQDDYSEVVTVALDGDIDRSITIKFPSLLQRDETARVAAIVDAVTLGNPATGNAGLFDDEFVTRELANALSVEEIDELLDELYPDNQEKSFLAGRGLNRDAYTEDPSVLQIVTPQSTGTGKTPDMGDAPATDQPITVPQGSELGIIASLRRFQETVRPLLEGKDDWSPLIVASPKPRTRTRETRSGARLRTVSSSRKPEAKDAAVTGADR